MRHTLIALFALSFTTACSDVPISEPTAPIDSGWAPFAYGELSTGVSERARFQVAACAYREVVALMPTCALDMPLMTGHRSAVLFEVAGAGSESATVRSGNQDVIAIRDLHAIGDDGIYKFELHATAAGSAELVVEGLDGTIDILTLRVRDAVALEIDVEGAEVTTDDEVNVVVGNSASLYARPVDADGNQLNAYEVDWSLAGDAGVTNAVNDFHTWIAHIDGVTPGTATLSARSGAAAIDVALRVTR